MQDLRILQAFALPTPQELDLPFNPDKHHLGMAVIYRQAAAAEPAGSMARRHYIRRARGEWAMMREARRGGRSMRIIDRLRNSEIIAKMWMGIPPFPIRQMTPPSALS